MNQVAEKSDNQEPVRVVEIGVKGLFGLYDHTVKLKDERVTIIHGPNGVGKTIFLKFLYGALTDKFTEISDGIAYSSFYIYFNNKKENVIQSNKNINLQKNNFFEVIFIDTNRLCSEKKGGFIIPEEEVFKINEAKSKLAETISKYKQKSVEELNDGLLRFPMVFAPKYKMLKSKPEILSCDNFIEDNIKKYIRCQELNLVPPISNDRLVNNEVFNEPDDVIKLVQLLNAEIIKRSLQVLDPILYKLELFLSLINKKLLNKNLKITLDSNDDIDIIVECNIGGSFNLYKLSTGEQHLFILYYTLLFNTNPNTLLIIDEPELSMHISWQRDFVDDLLKIIELNPIDVILATHSPSIINDHSNLMVAFKADVQQEAA